MPLWGLANSKICSMSWQPGDPGEPMVLSFSLKARRLETQEESMFQLESKDRKNSNVQVLRLSSRKNSLLLGGWSAFLVYSNLQGIGGGAPTLWRAICFTQSTDLNVNLIQNHPHRHTQYNVWPNFWASWDLLKLTCKINHHTCSGGKPGNM